MNGGVAGAGGEEGDHPLDLAPAAIMDDVAERAALARAPGRLERGMVAVMADQLVRVGDRRSVRQVDVIVQGPPLNSRSLPTGGLLPFAPAKLLNAAFTRKDCGAAEPWKPRPLLPWRVMPSPPPPPRKEPRSGGVLLALAIVAGAVGGAMGGQASIGVLTGVAAGLVMLGLVWLIDRRG